MTEGDERVAAILAESPLFGGLPDDARRLIEERLETVRVESGEWLMRKGDPGDALFLVETGRLAVVRGERPDGPIRLRAGSESTRALINSRGSKSMSKGKLPEPPYGPHGPPDDQDSRERLAISKTPPER